MTCLGRRTAEMWLSCPWRHPKSPRTAFFIDFWLQNLELKCYEVILPRIKFPRKYNLYWGIITCFSMRKIARTWAGFQKNHWKMLFCVFLSWGWLIRHEKSSQSDLPEILFSIKLNGIISSSKTYLIFFIWCRGFILQFTLRYFLMAAWNRDCSEKKRKTAVQSKFLNPAVQKKPPGQWHTSKCFFVSIQCFSINFSIQKFRSSHLSKII